MIYRHFCRSKSFAVIGSGPFFVGSSLYNVGEKSPQSPHVCKSLRLKELIAPQSPHQLPHCAPPFCKSLRLNHLQGFYLPFRLFDYSGALFDQ